MIRKSDGWIFADYVWNTEQTEAYFDLAGSITPITWKDDNDVINLPTIKYRQRYNVSFVIKVSTSKTTAR
jgi:hypothetical protein